jgi:hypothetical protein
MSDHLATSDSLSSSTAFYPPASDDGGKYILPIFPFLFFVYPSILFKKNLKGK